MTDSAPSRFLQGQASGTSLNDMRTLALDIFGGEVLTAYDMALQFADKVQSRTLGGGARSARFPKIWKASGEYHTAGKELLGNEIETGEITITPDELLVSHTAIYDLDDMLSHFDVRSQFAKELGQALARINDKNVARQIVLAARKQADGPFPGGNVITDAALTNSGVIDGKAWIDGIKAANRALFNKDVPETEQRYLAVNWDVFDAIKYATDSNGRYLVLDRQLIGSQGQGLAGRDETLQIDGVTVIKTRNLPTADESALNTVYSKYRADFSKTTGVLWTPMAVASVKMRQVTLENTRDVRRQENFMVASSLTGNGALRHETAVEFKTA
ncbi:hypothetical protein SAMN02983003_0623 [Devosia enhydra]|uniref:Capsid Gp10A/Gp10B-like domain-containing protein n=1 Tax=Devosia enhydra TaxID=665118 RepID=A0A1K2HVB2_9HYPH|nr:phage capsid protein [Devosia enhydra]SFZ81665.1 hypothetical protein SAMN02983003_0623 [Devosia enhydra]